MVLSAAALAGCGQAPGATPPTTSSSPSSPAGGAEAARTVEHDGAEGATPAPDGTGTGDAGGGAVDDGTTAGPTADASDGAREQAPAAPPPGDGADPDGVQPSAPVSDAPASVAPGDADDDDADDGEPVDLDILERTVLTLLRGARQTEGAPQLRLDAGLVSSSRERACAMAHGATPLLAEDERENIGLVVEADHDAAARAMHDWWMRSSETRDVRMAAVATNYGIGACTDGDHVYYAERFAP